MVAWTRIDLKLLCAMGSGLSVGTWQRRDSCKSVNLIIKWAGKTSKSIQNVCNFSLFLVYLAVCSFYCSQNSKIYKEALTSGLVAYEQRREEVNAWMRSTWKLDPSSMRTPGAPVRSCCTAWPWTARCGVRS